MRICAIQDVDELLTCKLCESSVVKNNTPFTLDNMGRRSKEFPPARRLVIAAFTEEVH